MKTLFLCFVHGFSGDNDTFRSFPQHIRDETQKALPDWKIFSVVYPKYETKGDLSTCVTRFREWLQKCVEGLEAEAGEDSKSDEPMVRTILMAHSMGGFVAADTILSIVDDFSAAKDDEQKKNLPWIHGLLTFDTPFVGIASPMLAYSAFSQFSRVSSAYRLMSILPASLMGGGKGIKSAPAAATSTHRRTPLELAAVPAWRTIAAYAGTTGALAAAGVAAYMNREEIREGYTWIMNHLQFVGVITKREASRLRLARVTALEGFGFENLYTSLGQNSVLAGGSYIPERTFCAIPPATNPLSHTFRKETNIVAKDEIDAHMSMFMEDHNPAYRRILEDSTNLVVEWARREFSGYKTRNLEERTTEAMESSTDEVPPAMEDIHVAANVPLPDDEADDTELAGSTDGPSGDVSKDETTDGPSGDVTKDETTEQASSAAPAAEADDADTKAQHSQP